MKSSLIGRIGTAVAAGLVLAIPAGALGDGVITITQDRTDTTKCNVEFTAKKPSAPYVWEGSYVFSVTAYPNANFSGSGPSTNTGYIAIANRRGVLAATESVLAANWAGSNINSAQINVNAVSSFAWSATATSRSNTVRYSNRCA